MLCFTTTAQTIYRRTAYKTVAHHAAAKVKVKTKRATGPVVYYCNSGNTVKYHASATCRVLSRREAANGAHTTGFGSTIGGPVQMLLLS